MTVSQSRTELSPLPVARKLPSKENFRSQTAAVCPVNGCPIGRPVIGSHRRTSELLAGNVCSPPVVATTYSPGLIPL